MPTPAEQKALAFVALVILLGGAVRVGRGGAAQGSPPTAAEREALALQATLVDSAGEARSRRNAGSRKKTKRGARGSSDDGAMMSGNDPATSGVARYGFPPPSPRIDSYGATAGGLRGGDPGVGLRQSPGGAPSGQPAAPVDVDRAAARELEALPYIGPALARRIVASRDSLGPFGSLEALGRVKGVGPATLRRLAPLVTFSGQARR